MSLGRATGSAAELGEGDGVDRACRDGVADAEGAQPVLERSPAALRVNVTASVWAT